MLGALVEIMQDFTDQSSLKKVLELIANLEFELTAKLEGARATNASQITEYGKDIVDLK